MKRGSSSQDRDLLKLLTEIKSLPADYPEELLSARRAAFMNQLDEYEQVETAEGYRPQDREMVELLGRMKSARGAYPDRLLSARRSAFTRRIIWLKLKNEWNGLRSAVRERFAVPAGPSPLQKLRTSLVLVALALAAAVGYFSSESQTTALRPLPTQAGNVRSGLMIASEARVVQVICRPGYEPPLCLAGAYKKDQPLTYHGNGSARPAVAKDTFTGAGNIHRAAFLNDGLYGPGASWISASPNSWIKIDLGKPTAINMVTFGRDRLGKFNDGNPGQFVIQVAIKDDVYEDGNSSNDSLEYKEVYDSEQAGFPGTVSRAETVTARFDLKVARYVKITFENAGAAVDEVEVFLVQPPMATGNPTRDRDKESPPNTATTAPTRTPLPADTATSVSTITPPPTVTPSPTHTPVPTDTPVPTHTLVPTDTPVPTHTPVPTDTPVPTHTPVPTDTSVPTDTPMPLPTDTPMPELTYIFPPQAEETSLPRPTNPVQSNDWPPGLERNTFKLTRMPDN